jgi:hypothetical protein
MSDKRHLRPRDIGVAMILQFCRDEGLLNTFEALLDEAYVSCLCITLRDAT